MYVIYTKLFEMTGRWFTNSFLITIHGKSLNAQIIPGSPMGE